MIHSKIYATGSYLPERIVTNNDLSESLDTSDEWIRERTGIGQRHILRDDENVVTMAKNAALSALEMADMSAESIDMIIFATCTPESFFPSCAAQLQDALNIEKNIPSFDVSVACAGFIYAMSIADAFIKTGQAENILIVGSEAMSRVLDWTDRRTCVLFGDAAGAAIIRKSDTPGIQTTILHADGSLGDKLYLKNKAVMPEHLLSEKAVHMDGRAVFKFAVSVVDSIVEDTLAACNMQKSDVNWLVPHQANLRIIKAIANKLELDMSSVILTIEDHANTAAASIPTTLDFGIRSGKIKKGDNLLLEGFGGGMAWGSALITY